MAETQFHIVDRIQFEQSQMRDRLTILEKRVAALEGGKPLPPAPKIEFAPTLPPTQAQPAPEQTASVTEMPIPDISVGWVGGRRG